VSAAFTPGPWVPTYFTRPDGTEIETVEQVAETTAHSARQGDGTTLHGVTLTGDDDGVVVCYTGNGPTSEANARLIAAAPDLYDALDNLVANVTEAFPALADLGPITKAHAALAKARGEAL
jgi:hypothetical protein